ncbi:hypothetical protein ACEQ6C_39520, partial [Rhizobium ruizarguesonis]
TKFESLVESFVVSTQARVDEWKASVPFESLVESFVVSTLNPAIDFFLQSHVRKLSGKLRG